VIKQMFDAGSDLLLVSVSPPIITEAAFRAGVNDFSDLVFALPDGETGERPAWVGYERERRCRPHPDLELVHATESPREFHFMPTKRPHSGSAQA
jgi:hypothetical protein